MAESKNVLQIPTFSNDERERRWRKIRELMFFREIDCLVVDGGKESWGNIRYISNMMHPGHCLFPQKGEPVIIGVRTPKLRDPNVKSRPKF